MADLIGQSLGRYHILEQLGEGGMAVVYKAFDTRLERNVAIKVILPGKAQKDKFLKRFEREAKALASLSHPNIVKVIDYGEHEGMPYLVMEYIPGGTLKQKLNGKQTSWQEAIRLLIPIAKALSYAHDNKIIHRDIKPANILITQSGEPMLSDFGIAKILEVEETLDLTGMGVRRPYQADTPMAVVWKLASEPLPRPKNYVDGLPDFIDQLLLKALSKDPKDRFQDMHEFSAALEMRLAMNKGKVHEKPKVGRPPALGIAAVIILILIAVAFAVLKYRTGTQAVPDNLTELAE
ncbi:MAG: serine/threonine-protein kinase, partial [Chloroflexi bacterium]|nr:serine/threonine-protein kinase [Chloroflexota bacterium]